ncbi:MAG: ABC transporter permease [Rubrobacter sp.]|jgi:osmoprotectant transport system permease protein|nr:ABC transporter permease [Rubrobacter sp.]
MRTPEQTRPEEKTRPPQSEAAETKSGTSGKPGGGGPTSSLPYKLARYLTMPIILAGVCAALYIWVSSQTLDSIEARNLNAELIIQKTIRHLEITVIATIAVVALAVSAGVILTRPVMRRVSPYIVAVASTGQAMPSIGVIVLIAVLLNQFGFTIAIVALVITAFLPVLRNTMVGIQQVDQSVIEAGRGMGMTKRSVLWKIELPLAIPIMLAGIRTALIIVVGTAALATFINAGGMGDFINTGIKLSRETILITGSVLTAVLALSVDYVAGIAEDVLRPKGL